MLQFDVVIIDSGVDSSILNYPPSGICVEDNNGVFCYSDDLNDTSGHGTAIFSIISKNVDEQKIFVIKLAGLSDELLDISLIEALKYVKENIMCKVINISLGILYSDFLEELYDLCYHINSRGTVIVSSFVNFGCYSYPAAFDCVVGVDNFDKIIDSKSCHFVANSPVNILAKGRLQRVKSKNGNIFFLAGSSIACAHISSIICGSHLKEFSCTKVLSFLKSLSVQIWVNNIGDNASKKQLFDISNAAVFPFSKEEQAFLRFSSMLNFNIYGYYDVKYSGNVGKPLSTFYENAPSTKFIKDINSIELSEIDTIIIGHTDKLNDLTGCNYLKKLINMAIEKKINIVSFDSLAEYEDMLNSAGVKYYYPSITACDVPQNSFGKLYKISRPVVGIFGTSSKQGKFSLQLSLKKELEAEGYDVGALGTEPHSLLFGFDSVFPMGYNSSVYIGNHETVSYLNAKINEMCMCGKDLVLVSSQAQFVPYYCNNLMEYPLLQYHFALGVKPDAIIMCINYHDDIQYIQNTVYALMGLTDASIIAFVMFPITYNNDSFYGKKVMVSKTQFQSKETELHKAFNIPVYLLNDEHINELCNTIIDTFSSR